MALTLEKYTLSATDLGEFVEYIRLNVDANDEESAIAAAPMLGSLAKNRVFLREILEKDIERLFDPDYKTAFYSGHSIILAKAGNTVVRANIWPEVEQFAGTYREKHVNSVYSYGIPHDHNFSFLTVGYLGPGYVTDIYEYDYWSVNGVLGESVNMRFLERTTLEEGKLMFFRRGRDIHIQHPPRTLSISLNVLLESRHVGHHDQFIFDVSQRKISGYVTGCDVSRKIGVLQMAAMLGGDSVCDKILRVARTAVTPRLRVGAYRALLASNPENWETYLRNMNLDPAQAVRDAANAFGDEKDWI